MPTNNSTNIWAQMGYTPPRGSCNFKQSLVSNKCPCLRFMVHPLKASKSSTVRTGTGNVTVSTSFECDGCSHHASFHNMSNAVDDAVVAAWAEKARQQQQQQEQERSAASRSNKRPRRAIEAAPRELGLDGLAELDVVAAAEGDGDGEGVLPAASWGQRFSSFAFEERAAEEPVKTPPKRSKRRG
ncbi:hypothetical protein K490DRAFT_61100 [Saccharata proteae CBS 121410]|uniref:Uncharacterized protein n=1 Tax=Saccharata proteae CBS 121410 TaxID=1314787 RepID=A0A9P4I1A8_9PEZI|nr:hypothetical protein K490DRAFT_61100 [Saccharata proteae CBS 121410]